MGTQEEEMDPMESGAAPWQEKAAEAAKRWAGNLTLVHEGVDLVRAVEYGILDQLNRRYLEASRE